MAAVGSVYCLSSAGQPRLDHGLTDRSGIACIPLCHRGGRASVLICWRRVVQYRRVTIDCSARGRIMTDQRLRQTPVIKGDALTTYTKVGGPTVIMETDGCNNLFARPIQPGV